MSENTLKRLVGVFAIVVAVWLVSSLFGGGSGSIAATGAVTGVFDEVGTSTAIRIERFGQTIELERAGEGWIVNGHPADEGAVARLLEILPDLEIGDLSANNPENHDRMGVSADSAITVAFTVGGEPRTILLGRSGRRFGSAYVRMPGADEVYLLEGDLRGQVTRDLDGWRNRTMVSVDSASIVRISFERPDGDYSLVRGDSIWSVEGGATAQQTAVNGVLSELARLVATGFLAEGDSIAALDLESTTRAYSATGEVLAEITIGAGDADRWARSTTDDYIYRVSSFRAGRVAPARESAEGGS